MMYSRMLARILQGSDTPSRICAISAKGGNFCDFLFALLHTKHFLKRRLPLLLGANSFLIEKAVFRGRKFFPYREEPFQKTAKSI